MATSALYLEHGEKRSSIAPLTVRGPLRKIVRVLGISVVRCCFRRFGCGSAALCLRGEISSARNSLLDELDEALTLKRPTGERLWDGSSGASPSRGRR